MTANYLIKVGCSSCRAWPVSELKRQLSGQHHNLHIKVIVTTSVELSTIYNLRLRAQKGFLPALFGPILVQSTKSKSDHKVLFLVTKWKVANRSIGAHIHMLGSQKVPTTILVINYQPINDNLQWVWCEDFLYCTLRFMCMWLVVVVTLNVINS